MTEQSKRAKFRDQTLAIVSVLEGIDGLTRDQAIEALVEAAGTLIGRTRSPSLATAISDQQLALARVATRIASEQELGIATGASDGS